MKYILIGFLLCSQVAFAQETPSGFWNNLCDYATDGTGKSLGLKIKMKVPCAWKHADGERPHVVRKFSFGFSDGSSIMQSIAITKMSKNLSKAEIDDLFTRKGLRELSKSSGTYLAGRKLKVDGFDCGEVMTKAIRNNPVGTFYLYMLNYYFVFEDKMILIGFSTGSLSEETSKSIFEGYKILFRGIASNMVILSKKE